MSDKSDAKRPLIPSSLREETNFLLYLYLRYNFTGILILFSIATVGSSVDLNMTVPVAI